MFTGLIRCLGNVKKTEKISAGLKLTLSVPSEVAGKMQMGDSIAVNGVCLTCTGKAEKLLELDISRETCDRTLIAQWRPNEQVNLELPLELGSRIEGHLVAGHVDDIVKIANIVAEGNFRRVYFQIDSRLMKFIAEKGSVAIDGISFTVAQINPPSGFAISIIPFSLQQTSLRNMLVGKKCHLEIDILARYAVNALQNK
jgi:riboflavin synthase